MKLGLIGLPQVGGRIRPDSVTNGHVTYLGRYYNGWHLYIIRQGLGIRG